MDYNNELFSYHSNNTPKENLPSFESHTHAKYELLFVFKGKGKFIIEDSEYLVRENSLFIIPPGEYHVMKLDAKTDYHRCVVNFSSSVIASFLGKKISLHQITDDKIRSIIEKMDYYAKNYPPQAFDVLLPALINEVLICATVENGQSNDKNYVPPLVKRTIDYVKASLYTELTAETIADALFVSKSHLSHVFSKTMGISIMRYVTIKKVHEARSLLRKGLSITEVCDKLGYNSYTTFLRNYRDSFGTNPSELKK